MFFETRATREKWLDRFAASNLPINEFCKMHHIKKEMLIKTLNVYNKVRKMGQKKAIEKSKMLVTTLTKGKDNG